MAVVKLNGREIICVYQSEANLLTTCPRVNQADEMRIIAVLKDAPPTTLRTRRYDSSYGIKA